MTTSERTLRAMREQLTEASQKLAQARKDGNYKTIRFWIDRENLLLDRLANLANRTQGDE